jgi:peptide/nickel transport system ATP-binding protein
MTAPLLQIEDLHVTFSTRRGPVQAVRGITLSVEPGEMLGLVGESGSGKSVTGFAVTRLLDKAGRITGGCILFNGQDITRASGEHLRSPHGAAVSMIFQNPRAALNRKQHDLAHDLPSDRPEKAKSCLTESGDRLLRLPAG